MKKYQSIFGAVIGALLVIGTPATVSAQEDGAEVLEEITVTGRKREENLVDVPVSISVVSKDVLTEQGIVNMQDLYDAVPGITYDVGIGDRNSSQPAVRGIQASTIATTLQKVNSFIDGIPMLGQIGSLTFNGIEQVEVYRGPQSAAFGRSTFAGAINYVTADATEDFEFTVQARTSSLEDNELGLAISGPLGDKFGYRLSYIVDTFTGPDEWTANDGYKLGDQETKTLIGKLNFEFTDSIYGELMYTNLEQDDGATVRWLLDPETCSGDSGLFRLGGGRRIELPSGEWDCDIFADSDNPQLRNHDVLGQFNANYDDHIDEYTAASPPGADLDGDGIVSREEYLAQTSGDGQTYEDLLLGQTVEPFVNTTRDRIQGELNFDIGDGVLQFLGMYTEETYQRWFEVDGADSFPVIAMGMLGMNVFSMSDPTTIEENYAEARWVSPGDKRFRYTLSGSYYTYDFHTDVYVNYGAIGHDLMLPSGDPVSPRRVIIVSNNTTNYGASFGLQYDLTDRTTLSLEGRYQNDENCGIDETIDVTDCVSATSFAPRLAINSAISDNHSIYGQISVGTNPGGVNIIYSNPDVILSLDVAGGRTPVPDLAPDGFTVPVNAGVLYDGVGANPPPVVDYDVATFQYYDEEVLTNFEIGSKGVYGGGRGSYAVALYYMLWDKNIVGRTLDWDDVTPEGWNAGDWSPQSGARTFFNEGESILTGIEFETDFHFNDVWAVGGNLALQDATFDSYCSDQGPLYTTSDTPPFETVLPVLTPEEDGVRASCSVVDGNQIPRTSQLSGALNVRATLPGDVLGFLTTFRADLRHTGSHYTDDLNLIERGAVSIWNLSANMRNDDIGLTLRLYVNNVTDEEDPINLGMASYYTDNANPTVPASFVRSWNVTPRRPREIGLTAIYNFQ